MVVDTPAEGEERDTSGELGSPSPRFDSPRKLVPRLSVVTRLSRDKDDTAAGCAAEVAAGGREARRGRVAVLYGAWWLALGLLIATAAAAAVLARRCGPCSALWSTVVPEAAGGERPFSLSLAGSALAVSFRAPPAPALAWGASPGRLNRVAFPQTGWVVDRASEPDTVSSPTSAHAVPPQQLTTVLLAPRPGEPRRVSFTLPGGDTAREAPVWSVPLPPLPGDDASPLVLALVGDLGSSPESARTVARMAGALPRPHAALLLGDLAYAEKAGAGDCGRTRSAWRDWDALAAPLLSTVPTLAVRGNHDRFGGCEALDGSNGFAELASRFPAQPLAWWSLSAGAAHIIGLSSSDDVAPGSAQRAWLEENLARVDRRATPWLILLWHVSWHHSSERHKPPTSMMAALEPLMLLHGVDVVFAAHVHTFERTVPMSHGQPDPCGPVYITVGTGGNWGAGAHEWAAGPPPVFTAARARDSGHGSLAVTRASMTWRFHANDAPPGAAADEAVFVKPDAARCPTRGGVRVK